MMAPMSQPDQRQLVCPLCACTEFQQEAGRLESKWGMTKHRVILMICQRCRYILHFYDRRSIFGFD